MTIRIPAAASLLLFSLACGGGDNSSGGADSTSAGATAAASGAGLTGAGATFPNPIYTKWFDAYAKATGRASTTSPSAPAAASGSSPRAPWTSAPPTAR